MHDGLIDVANRRNVELEIAVATVQAGGRGATGKGRVKRAEVWAEDIRRTERLVKRTPCTGAATAPFVEGRIAPGNLEVCRDDRYAVRECFQNALGLKKVFSLLPNSWVMCVGVDAVESFLLEQSESSHGVIDPNQVPVGLTLLQRVAGRVAGAFQNEDSLFLRHCRHDLSLQPTMLSGYGTKSGTLAARGHG